jgi:acetyl esterase/lipase
MNMKFCCLIVASAAILLSGCTKFDALNATVPFSGYQRTADLPYGSLPKQKLDVYRPDSLPSNADVVIFFYGGDWQNGEKADYRFVAQALTSRGFIAVLPDYRKYPSVTFPAFVEDGALAVRWVHDNIKLFGGDPQHVYLVGHSAGAHIAAMLTLNEKYLKNVGLDRSAIRATVGISGPYDFIPYKDDWGVFGMTAEGQLPDPEIEPINFVDGHQPPMLLLQGLNDKTVNPNNARKLADRIQQAGGRVQLIEYPSSAHVQTVMAFAWSFRWLAPVLRDTTEFIHRMR